MNGVRPNSIKESPKTPGGISKSLLTPCRRVGLSRKWKKSGGSPFVSPLNAQNTTPETGIREEKKRKKCDENEYSEVNSEKNKELDIHHESCVSSPLSSNKSSKKEDITSTPCRNNPVSRKKSKVLSLSLQNSQETDKEEVVNEKLLQLHKLTTNESKIDVKSSIQEKSEHIISNEEIDINQSITVDVEQIKKLPEENVSKLTRTESKSKKLSLKKSLSKSECKNMSKDHLKPKDSVEPTKPKEKSPNNLTKECIVVIQNKILKSDPPISNEKEKPIPVHDSDSEPDVPLSNLKRKSSENVTLNTLDDDDFISKPVKKKIKNLSIKKHKITCLNDSNHSSQSSQEEMDRRTILVKKTYEKVIKPQKAKSTGSITQKDIDDLKARIEMKKKLLLAKSMSIDTEELRDLIKKWQKGCQDALMELLDLMKKKLPDRKNMDYAEILQTLKIPAELVGYDSDNYCFITPDDSNILLSAFKL